MIEVLIHAITLAPALAPTPQPIAPVPAAVTQGVHEDDHYGFKIKPPRDWTAVPLQTNEGWIVAKFVSEKSYFYTDKATGYTYEHQPDLRVIAFVAAKKDEATVKEDKEKGEVRVRIESPFEDYPDYLEKTYRGGGFYISDEKSDEYGGLPTTQYEIKVEKLTRSGPKRIITWVFHSPEVDLAVQVETLEEHYSKLKKNVLASIRSFKFIPRKGGGLPTARSGGEIVVRSGGKGAVTPEDRRKQRMASEKAYHDKAKRGLPDDWEVQEVGRYLVLNHASSRAGKRKVAQSEGIMTWLDKTFPFIGPNEYVRAPVIRVCKDWEEELTFRDGTGGLNLFSQGLEIVTHDDKSGSVGPEKGWINVRSAMIWFSDRDGELRSAMPSWFITGLAQALQTAEVKGKKVEFKNNDWARERLRERERDGDLISPHDLMNLTSGDFSKQRRQDEAAMLVRYMLTSKYDDTLTEYLKNLQFVQAEMKAQREAEDDEDDPEPQTEEEEEELFKKRQNRWKELERKLLDDTFARTFESWSARDWTTFEKAYFRTVK